MTEGELLLRDAEEPAALNAPTTISGTQDTQGGALTGLAFNAAPIQTEAEALGQHIDVTAVFTQVVANGGLGQIDTAGNVVVQATLHADVHLEVGVPPFIITDCRSTPIALELRSTAPYDPETGTVTLRDGNFTIAPVPPGTGCDELVREPLNDLLAGPGHALTVTFQGDLAIPDPRDPAAVALAVSPPSPSQIGTEVTLDVAVTPAPGSEATDVPTGLVDLRAGDTILASVPLDDEGRATFTTTDLVIGTHALTATYTGDATYGEATSTPVEYTITSSPVIEITGPESIRRGTGPQEYTITVGNTGLGTTVEDARLDLTIGGPSGAAVVAFHFQVERQVGETWEAVPLTQVPGNLGAFGTVGPPADLTVDGPARVERIRISLPEDAFVGDRTITVEVVPDDAGEPAPAPAAAAVASQTKPFTVLLAERVPTTVAFSSFLPISPQVARPGYDVVVYPEISAASPTPGVIAQNRGTSDVLVNGRVVATYDFGLPWQFLFALPLDTPAGPADIALRYHGDAMFGPSEASTTITVAAPLAPVYECGINSPGAVEPFNVHLQATALLPAAATAGGPISLEALDIRLAFSRMYGGATFAMESVFLHGQAYAPGDGIGTGSGTLSDFGFTFGPDGAGTAQTLTRNGTGMLTPEPGNVDSEFVFAGETGTVIIDGAPGDIVPVTIEEFWIDTTSFGVPVEYRCAPQDAPAILGEVEVAGTALTVDAPTPTRVGDPVTLTATVAPAGASGIVEFLDGDHTLAVVAVADDTVTLTTTLPEGERVLRARFFALGVPSSVSDTATVTVLPAHDCGAFAVEGNGAVVRLVYMELLNRCPDQVGFDFWVGRLDGGTSPEAFARTIARSPEAVGVVVNDGYQVMLGRNAEPEGRDFWVNRMLTGNGRYDQLLASLAGEQEFWNLSGGTNEGFVTRVYERLLNRTPEQAGLNYWTGRLNAGTPPGVLVQNLANLDEPLSVLVDQSYDQILARAPFTAERTNGITFLRATGDRSGLYAQLIGHPEFTQRAQGLPNFN